MKEAIIGGIFALLGSLVTFLGTYLANLNTKKEERNRKFAWNSERIPQDK